MIFSSRDIVVLHKKRRIRLRLDLDNVSYFSAGPAVDTEKPDAVFRIFVSRNKLKIVDASIGVCIFHWVFFLSIWCFL